MSKCKSINCERAVAPELNLDFCSTCYYNHALQEVPDTPITRAKPTLMDAVVEANRALLLYRSQVGLNKYGTTLAQAGLNRRQLLQHALEEALDLANYLQTEIMQIDANPQ